LLSPTPPLPPPLPPLAVWSSICTTTGERVSPAGPEGPAPSPGPVKAKVTAPAPPFPVLPGSNMFWCTAETSRSAESSASAPFPVERHRRYPATSTPVKRVTPVKKATAKRGTIFSRSSSAPLVAHPRRPSHSFCEAQKDSASSTDGGAAHVNIVPLGGARVVPFASVQTPPAGRSKGQE
jgi:hypothetical protein